jgi:hypothetical protein
MDPMKIVRTSLGVFALGLAVSGTAAAQDSRVSVVFAHPEQYTDLKITCVSGPADARALMGEIERFWERLPPAACSRGSGSRSR